jgi:adhesin transport system outer membrane protein
MPDRKFLSLVIQSIAILMLACQARAESLNAVIQQALVSHPSIQAQQSQAATAKAEKEFARQQFYPTPSISLEQNLTSGNGNTLYRGDNAQLIFRVQQPLWTGGRLSAGLSKAQAQIDASSSSIEEARELIALKTIQAWGDWYGADLKVKALELSVVSHEKLHAQVKRRVEIGASAPAELVLTDSRVAQTISSLKAYQSLARTAKVRLLQLIGKSTELNLTNEQYLNAQLSNLETLQAKVQAYNPTIRKLHAKLEAQSREIDVQKSQLMPDVYLRAEHQQGNFFYNNLQDTNLVFLGVSTKFGAGLSSLSGIEVAKNQKEAIQHDLETAERNILEQVQSDWIGHLSLLARLPFLEDSVLSTKATAEAWDRQFLAGKKSWLEVMNTARELAQAELELADVKASLIETDWRLAVLTDGVDAVLHQASQLQPKDHW